MVGAIPPGASGSLQNPLLPPHRSPWTMLATTGSPPRASGERSSLVFDRRASILSEGRPPAFPVSLSMWPSRCSSQKSAQFSRQGRFGWKVAPMVLSTGNPKGASPFGDTPALCIFASATPSSYCPPGPLPQNSRYSKRAKAWSLASCLPKAIGLGTRMVEVSDMALTPSYSARSMSYPFRADLRKYRVSVSASRRAPVLAPPPPEAPPPVVGVSFTSLPRVSDAAVDTVSRKVAAARMAVEGQPLVLLLMLLMLLLLLMLLPAAKDRAGWAKNPPPENADARAAMEAPTRSVLPDRLELKPRGRTRIMVCVRFGLVLLAEASLERSMYSILRCHPNVPLRCEEVLVVVTVPDVTYDQYDRHRRNRAKSVFCCLEQNPWIFSFKMKRTR
ncbi:unnamed protein product [Pseudo-nitzschia multistriata]|uniref:Uncharacterized protein n=1 Tax=Pseudo-nitzschia multistriata TaxID=183589 RepID=A0A448ZS27_9STRA|nr:unnamed protein product [Pseudo-nitzschia multistriata]